MRITHKTRFIWYVQKFPTPANSLFISISLNSYIIKNRRELMNCNWPKCIKLYCLPCLNYTSYFS